MNLTVREISKKFLYKNVLCNINTTFKGGSIHALLGENGSGKTTLSSILSGNIQPTSGSIYSDNKKLNINNTKDALNYGIVLVHQTPLLASELTVKENIILKLKIKNYTGTKVSLLKKIPDELIELKNKWAKDLDFNAYVKNLNGNKRFYTSLLSALYRHPECLILDEPSAFLNIDERKELYKNLTELKKKGIIIIVITHSKAEAVNYCDSITLLQKEKTNIDFNTIEEYKDFINKKENNQIYSKAVEKKFDSVNKICFCIKDASSFPKQKAALLNASFNVYYSQITGITGIQESSIGTLEDLVTGLNTLYSRGKIELTVNNKTFKADIKKKEYSVNFLRKHNTAIVSSDKNNVSSFPLLTIEQLLSVYINKNRKYFSENLIKKAGINIKPEQKVKELSGGMLQRLILERELSLNPDFIILCNPLQGLDSISQQKLCNRIVELSNNGKAILIIGAEDFPLTLCTEVYSLKDGILELSYSRNNQNI